MGLKGVEMKTNTETGGVWPGLQANEIQDHSLLPYVCNRDLLSAYYVPGNEIPAVNGMSGSMGLAG